MNVATAWMVTTMLTLLVWGSAFGITWGNAKTGKVKRVARNGTFIVLILGFLSFIALIWFSTFTGIYVGGKGL